MSLLEDEVIWGHIDILVVVVWKVKTLLAGPSPTSPMKAEITISPISNRDRHIDEVDSHSVFSCIVIEANDDEPRARAFRWKIMNSALCFLSIFLWSSEKRFEVAIETIKIENEAEEELKMKKFNLWSSEWREWDFSSRRESDIWDER